MSPGAVPVLVAMAAPERNPESKTLNPKTLNPKTLNPIAVPVLVSMAAHDLVFD